MLTYEVEPAPASQEHDHQADDVITRCPGCGHVSRRPRTVLDQPGARLPCPGCPRTLRVPA